jgi:hypothetical protein
MCYLDQAWCWNIPVIPALGRLRQEDLKFETSLSYTDRDALRRKVGRKEGRKI